MVWRICDHAQLKSNSRQKPGYDQFKKIPVQMVMLSGVRLLVFLEKEKRMKRKIDKNIRKWISQR